MNEEWITRDYDMRTAAQVINKHVEKNKGEPLGIFEVNVVEDSERAKVRLSGWILDLAERYYVRYGRKQGDFVTKMVVAKCIMNGRVIH